MVKFRIIKRSGVHYTNEKIEKWDLYIIQKRFMFFWFSMSFDDYAESIMCFDSLKKAEYYLFDLVDYYRTK